MGGRAAEYIKYGKYSTGPSNDLKVATEMVRAMVTEYGMSEKLGPVCYNNGQEMFLGRDFQSQREYSEHTAQLIDDEVRSILQEQFERAVKILKEKDAILENMTQVLLEKETIYSEDVESLMKGESVEQVVQKINERQAALDEQDKKARDEKEKKDKEKKEHEQKKIQHLREQAMIAYELGVEPDEVDPKLAEEKKAEQLNNETIAEEKQTDVVKNKTEKSDESKDEQNGTN